MSDSGFGGIQFGVGTSGAREISPQTPFQLCLVGDFSGRGNRGQARGVDELRRIRPLPLDRDDFEDVLQRLRPRLQNLLTAPDGSRVSLEFNELDDFHPDAIFHRAPLFSALRTTRNQLQNPATFDAAASEVRSWMSWTEPEMPPAHPPAKQETPEIDSANLLDTILDASSALARPPDSDPWTQLIRELVGPHISAASTQQQAELVSCVDGAINETMNRLLQHRDFQQLEAAWRGLYRLVRAVETDSGLKLFLLDVAGDELKAVLASAEDPRQSPVGDWLSSAALLPGGQPYAALVVLFPLHADAEELQALTWLTQVCAATHTSLLGSASGSLVGCDNPPVQLGLEQWSPPWENEAWRDLRQSPLSAWTCLAWPRYLLRLPYGPNTSPVESFKMSERVAAHEDYLWGSPAMIMAALLAQSFTKYGWQLRPGDPCRVAGLPVHIQTIDGEAQAHPCGELLIDEKMAQHLLRQGISPLLSVRDQDQVEIRAPLGLNGQPLAGRWS